MTTSNNATGQHDRGPRLSAADKHMRNSYLREFLPALACFGVLQAIVEITVDETTSGASLWVLFPVLPLVGIAVALFRAVQRADEYGRIVMLECMAIGFGVAMIVAVGLGFLGGIGQHWSFGGWLVFGSGMTAWSGTLLVRGLT